MTKPKSFIHPELGEIVGYSSLAEFEEAVDNYEAEHADDIFACGECPATFDSPMLYDAHRMEVHGYDPYGWKAWIAEREGQ